MKQLYVMIFYTLKTMISKNGVKTDSETNAYYLISLYQGINLLSVFNILKSIFDLIVPSFFFYVFLFFVPPFLFNYLFFIRKKRYEILIKEVFDEPISPKWLLIILGTYLVFTIFFFGFSIWVNT